MGYGLFLRRQVTSQKRFGVQRQNHLAVARPFVPFTRFHDACFWRFWSSGFCLKLHFTSLNFIKPVYRFQLDPIWSRIAGLSNWAGCKARGGPSSRDSRDSRDPLQASRGWQHRNAKGSENISRYHEISSLYDMICLYHLISLISTYIYKFVMRSEDFLDEAQRQARAKHRQEAMSEVCLKERLGMSGSVQDSRTRKWELNGTR